MRRPPRADTPERRSWRRLDVAVAIVGLVPVVFVLYWLLLVGLLGGFAFDTSPWLASVYVAGLAAQVAVPFVVGGRAQRSWSFAIWTWIACGAAALWLGFEAMEVSWPLAAPRVPGWNTVLDGGEPNLVLVSWLHALGWWALLRGRVWLRARSRVDGGPPVPRA